MPCFLLFSIRLLDFMIATYYFKKIRLHALFYRLIHNSDIVYWSSTSLFSVLNNILCLGRENLPFYTKSDLSYTILRGTLSVWVVFSAALLRFIGCDLFPEFWTNIYMEPIEEYRFLKRGRELSPSGKYKVKLKLCGKWGGCWWLFALCALRKAD